ncbi:MAG: transposase [Anaerolineae bacterium]|nr:transposase [Anaerolineae bacterium]
MLVEKTNAQLIQGGTRMSILQLVAKCTPQEWQVPLELSPLPGPNSDKGLWIDPVTLIQELNGWVLAEWAIGTAQRLQFWALPKPRGPGAPLVYHDASVLLTSLVAAAWRLSFERIIDWLARYDGLAEILGYDQFDTQGRRRTISLAQYSRRLKELGLLPYLLIFIALVAALLKMGVIKGWDLIIDSSLLAAWSRDDPDAAWSWPSAHKGRVFGYKVHTILCRWSYLPLFFVVTPAQRHDGPLAIPMFAAVLLLYRLRIHIVRADAAYFNYAFLGFVHRVLRASVNVDYNLRRQGKRFLAELFFIRQWHDLMSPRANIERHFAWMKRYFGLKYFRVQGYLAVTQFVFRVYIAALIVAFIAARHQRPELATSRLKVLAFATT